MNKYFKSNKRFIINRSNKVTIITFTLILLILCVFIVPVNSYCKVKDSEKISQELNQSVVEELNQIDFSGINSLINDLNENQTKLFSLNNIKSKVYSILSGESAVEYDNFFAVMLSGIIEVVVKYIPLLSIIVAIGVVGNLLNGMKSKFNEKSTQDLIHLVCFLSVAVIIIGIINNLTKSAGNSIGNMVKQINVIFPVLLTLMIGMGATATAGVFQPVVAIMSTYIADIFNYFIVPLFMLSFVFSLISNLSTNVKLDKFNTFISSLFKWSVGLVFTLFFAVFSIQGITAGSFDSIGIRTTKYTIKSYVPVMGGYLSDGMDLIMSSTVLIKNAIGLVGVLLVITTIISPIIEIAVCSLMLKLVSAIMQPLGNNKTSSFLSSTSKSITMLSSSILAIGFMYLITIGLCMTTSNLVVWYVKICVKYFRDCYVWNYNWCNSSKW